MLFQQRPAASATLSRFLACTGCERAVAVDAHGHGNQGGVAPLAAAA